jgi:hypothetical protein
MVEARSKAAQLTLSPEFRDLVVNGLSPDGSFEWTHSGIVRVLREATYASGVDGWTRLDEALAWIADQHPEQIPQKYGCRTWPRVLTESRQFDLQYRAGECEARVGWCRVRIRATGFVTAHRRRDGRT